MSQKTNRARTVKDSSTLAVRKLKSLHQDTHSSFDQLNGDHPWRDFAPQGFIDYPARELPKGNVIYFNFSLAKEMGLISNDHPHTMTLALEKKLLSTFSLRIINEYDHKHKKTYPLHVIKKNLFMATRYLQLQHQNKQGRTSGDGRCIWNGVVKHEGSLWDVSSRGVGVTALAPGIVEAGKPLPSGQGQFGYGCGTADLDELLATAILAEIFHEKNINTERILTVIDLGNGIGIGVRAGKNLLRPAHILLYLKQGEKNHLRHSLDYLIIRQHRNKEWRFGIHHPERYDFMLQELIKSFAHFVAILERNYIFAWLDWDGDNVLANAGIIDYGSIRQFGLRHDQYRYDDVERYSTCLNEQKVKARKILQTFIQAVYFLKHDKKKSLCTFNTHPYLLQFDTLVKQNLRLEFLYQLGFNRRSAKYLLKKHVKKVETLYRYFTFLERKKYTKKMIRVADGINRLPLFNMRKLIYHLTFYYFENQKRKNKQIFSSIHLKKIYLSILPEYVRKKQNFFTFNVRQRLQKVIQLYQDLFDLSMASVPTENRQQLQLQICRQARWMNQKNRITGNALIHIVDELLDSLRKGLPLEEVQKVIDQLIESQNQQKNNNENALSLAHHSETQKLMSSLFRLIDNHKEDI